MPVVAQRSAFESFALGPGLAEVWGDKMKLVLFFWVLFAPVAGIAQVVACDLVDASAAASVLGQSDVKGTVNRQTLPNDGAKFSVCIFTTSRTNFKTLLFEFPGRQEALRAFSRYTAPGSAATYSPESGLGDAAAWWRIGNEAYGFTVLAGKYVLILDSRVADPTSEREQKARMRPLVSSGLRKLLP